MGGGIIVLKQKQTFGVQPRLGETKTKSRRDNPGWFTSTDESSIVLVDEFIS